MYGHPADDSSGGEDDEDAPMDLSVKRRPGPSQGGMSHIDHHDLSHHASLSGLGAGSGGQLGGLYNDLAANPYTIFSYYYLMNQSPLASRASVAAAMADAYSKLTERMISVDTYSKFGTSERASEPGLSPDYPNQLEHLRPGSKFGTETASSASSPAGSEDCANGKTELRSADTTHGIHLDANGERKRISRPLTGRHVRHGTGASPSTLLVLRKLLKERQRLRDLGIPLPSAKKTRRAAKRK